MCRRCEYGSIFDPDTRAALKMNVLSVTPYEACAVGNYRVTGYPANHGTDQGSLLYSIEQGHMQYSTAQTRRFCPRRSGSIFYSTAHGMTCSFSITPMESVLTRGRQTIWDHETSSLTLIDFAKVDCSRTME